MVPSAIPPLHTRLSMIAPASAKIHNCPQLLLPVPYSEEDESYSKRSNFRKMEFPKIIIHLRNSKMPAGTKWVSEWFLVDYCALINFLQYLLMPTTIISTVIYSPDHVRAWIFRKFECSKMPIYIPKENQYNNQHECSKMPTLIWK